MSEPEEYSKAETMKVLRYVGRMLSTTQTAAYLNVSPSAIAKLRLAGEFPVVKMGGIVRFDRADLDAYVERCKVTDNQTGDDNVQ